MTGKANQISVTHIAAPRSASFAAYWKLFHYGLPLLGALAGFVSLPIWLAAPVGALFAWVVPELWPMRAIPSVILNDRFDIPRAMFLSTSGFIFLLGFAGFGMCHVLGSLLLWYITGGADGVALQEVLFVALPWVGLWFLSRLLRPILQRKNAEFILEAERRRRETIAAFTSELHPRMIEASINGCAI